MRASFPECVQPFLEDGKNEVWSREIILTIDCCRGTEILHGDVGKDSSFGVGWRTLSHSTARQAVDLGSVRKNSIFEQFFTLYATENKHISCDENSLTKELCKVTNAGNEVISILDLCRAVNDSWRKGGIDYQTSQSNKLEIGDNWKTCFWLVGEHKQEQTVEDTSHR